MVDIPQSCTYIILHVNESRNLLTLDAYVEEYDWGSRVAITYIHLDRKYLSVTVLKLQFYNIDTIAYH